jgi:hypothetical protein
MPQPCGHGDAVHAAAACLNEKKARSDERAFMVTLREGHQQ